MQYKIVKLKEKEIPILIQIHNKYLGEREYLNKKEILKRIQNNTGIFLLAKNEKDQIIGIKIGYVEGDTCIGRGIAVEKGYRKQGVGKALVKEFERILKQYPKVKKYIFASTTIEGIPFHISLGYKPSILIQSSNEIDIKGLNLHEDIIKEKIFNKQHNVYQVYTHYNEELDYEYFNTLKNRYANIDIQYLFEKEVREMGLRPL